MRYAVGTVLPIYVLASCAAPSSMGPAGKDLAARGAPIGNKGGKLISDRGGGLISDQGGGLISANGAGIVGKVKAPASLIGNHGGGILWTTRTRYGVRAAFEQVPLPDAEVALLDVRGTLVPGPDGKPLKARTDAEGVYRFEGFGVARNLVVAVQLPEDKGQLRAIAHKDGAGRPVDLDAASTLTATYLLEAIVRGQDDPQAALDKLTPEAQAGITAETAKGLASGKVALPQDFTPEAVKKTVEALRGQDASLDAQLKEVTDTLAAAPASPSPTSAAILAPKGTWTLVAGLLQTQGFADADGPASTAQFASPRGVVADGAGDLLVADSVNNRIRKVAPLTRVVTTLAGTGAYAHDDGPGAGAKFRLPSAIAIDGAGNLFVADNGQDDSSKHIRRISQAGEVSTLAGTGEQGYVDGPGLTAKFGNLWAITVDSAGNVYVVDDARIRKISPAGVVSTVAGSTEGFADGPGASAKFFAPSGITADAAGNLYVGDSANHRIRKITSAGVVSTLAGGTGGFADGTGASAKFSQPARLTADGAGNLYVVDGDDAIRKVTPTGEVSTVALVGSVIKPWGIAIGKEGILYCTDVRNHCLWKWSEPVRP